MNARLRTSLLGWAAAIAIVLLSTTTALAAPKSCATIQSETITAMNGDVLTTGFDQYGYNYQAHLFEGTFDSSDRNIDGMYAGTTVGATDKLIMKWSDDWLSNVDCDGDGKLDRGFGTSTPGISRGWLTNLATGDGYTAFTKMVWVGPGGDLWGQYTTVLDVYNEPAEGEHGVATKLGAPGFGLNDGWTTTGD